MLLLVNLALLLAVAKLLLLLMVRAWVRVCRRGVSGSKLPSRSTHATACLCGVYCIASSRPYHHHSDIAVVMHSHQPLVAHSCNFGKLRNTIQHGTCSQYPTSTWHVRESPQAPVREVPPEETAQECLHVLVTVPLTSDVIDVPEAKQAFAGVARESVCVRTRVFVVCVVFGCVHVHVLHV